MAEIEVVAHEHDGVVEVTQTSLFGGEGEAPPTQLAQRQRVRNAGATVTPSESPRGVASLPDEISVKRSDAVYNAHAYLTKVPVTAIAPFIEAFTERGELVLDMYAGSGMTGVAAAMVGRRAEVRDISALGQHIGSNYVNLVDPEAFRAAAKLVTTGAKAKLDDVYATPCARCSQVGELIRTVWSFVYKCKHCDGPVTYYEAYKASNWVKESMQCPTCEEPLTTRGAERTAEVPVLDTISCACAKKFIDQQHTDPIHPASLDGLSYPDVPIGADRQMFQASALSRHGLLTTAAFFSTRNLAVLAALREQIVAVEDEAIRGKLLFAFTAVLARASKRYQWHPKRPLNAANQNYYIAPVFYEWNVYELFERKIAAALRSDSLVRETMAERGVQAAPEVSYRIGSADTLDLTDKSVDYVFTDPPFGSNIFYSDMNLFQEAWIGSLTDHADEAVVDRSGNGAQRRTAERYERLIRDSLKEAHRVLKDRGWLSLVFSNSSGAMWALVQRAVQDAGFVVEQATILNKGQRSVKGLASGFENVVTVDLILSMRKASSGEVAAVKHAPEGAVEVAVRDVLERDASPTPSHVYLAVVRDYLSQRWDVADLHIEEIAVALERLGYSVDSSSGQIELAKRGRRGQGQTR